MKDLDIEVFLRTQKEMRIAVKTIFTRMERFLIRNNQKFVLNSDSPSESGSDIPMDGLDWNHIQSSTYFNALLAGTKRQPKSPNAKYKLPKGNPSENAINPNFSEDELSEIGEIGETPHMDKDTRRTDDRATALSNAKAAPQAGK